ESLEGVGVVGRDEHQGRKGGGVQGACQIDAVQRVHLYIQKEQLRLQRPNCAERRCAVAELADDGKVVLGVAQLAQRAPAGEFVVHDDDVHQTPTKGAAR